MRPVVCRIIVLALFAVAVFVRHASAESSQPAESAQAMVGGWEISTAERDRHCGLTFSVEPASGGHKVEFAPDCVIAFPALADVVAWTFAKNMLRLIDAKSAAIMEFTEVESGMFESERRADGLLFLQTQAALKADIRTVEQMTGDWYFLREADKPLCRITLSGEGEGDLYKIVIKPGCTQVIAAFGLATCKLDRDQLLLNGKSGTWRFSEADPATWERVPLTADPLLLIRQQ